MEKIILPANLQQKIIKSVHSLGHLGTSKTKQMLREKYWFPGMNHLISQTIGSCFDCQIATKSHRQEPNKPSVIPEEPWEQICRAPVAHFVEHRALMREAVSSTPAGPTLRVLK